MKRHFFSRLDWIAFAAATLVSFAVYFFTLGPSVGMEDAGELATAAANLGVPHPPGYPFWTVCSWIFSKAFGWFTYMGHPSPAWGISLCSAFFGALAAGCTAMLICRSARDFLGDGLGAVACGGGVAGALAFALSPVEWSQSTIVEVYSLNAFFLMCVMLLSYRWMRSPTDWCLWTTAYVFGLGLTNYQVLVFAGVPLAIVMFVRNRSLFRDVVLYLVPAVLTWQVLRIGRLGRASAYMDANVICKHAPLMEAEAPSSFLIVVALVLLLGALAAAAATRGRIGTAERSRLCLRLGAASVGILFLGGTVLTTKTTWTGVSADVAPLVQPTLYVKIAAALAACVVASAIGAVKAEGMPDAQGLRARLAGQVNAASIAAAAFAVLAVLMAANVPAAGSFGYHGAPFAWGRAAAVFWAGTLLLVGLCAFLKKGLFFAIPVVGVHATAFLLLSHGALNGLTHPCSWWFGWPVAWNFVVLALAWLTLPNGRSVAGAALFAQLGVAFYAYMPLVSDLLNPPMNWGYARTWEGFKNAITRGQYATIGLPGFQSAGDALTNLVRQVGHYVRDVRLQFTDGILLFAAVPFAAGAWVVRRGERRTFLHWMIALFACFAMMSALLIVLADIKGDVHDGFVQKVKFISSHAMLAVWIGYGFIFAAALCLRRLAGSRWMRPAMYALSAVLVAVTVAVPVFQNASNGRLVFELGGNEQSGHTFGWQYGAYQLEGSRAISQELDEEEEPLPDADWPPPMGKDAVLFGGSDAGRFVPTYMVYSADYRPDVHVITQNALADDTTMSVYRDLYGNDIWIPSSSDNALAFNVYSNEVLSGKCPSEGVKLSNGGIQVTGNGVMQIGGMLARRIFDENCRDHEFYYQESTPIDWMTPHLEPHGLVMRLKPQPALCDAETLRKDRDFWDWYVRRLLKDPKYRRDFAAQKEFAMLRSSIARVHAMQGRGAPAAQAYREALILNPLATSSAWQYACATLVPNGSVQAANELLDHLLSLDPGNASLKSLRQKR